VNGDGEIDEREARGCYGKCENGGCVRVRVVWLSDTQCVMVRVCVNVR
jgi:hypothetical protein